MAVSLTPPVGFAEGVVSVAGVVDVVEPPPDVPVAVVALPVVVGTLVLLNEKTLRRLGPPQIWSWFPLQAIVH